MNTNSVVIGFIVVFGISVVLPILAGFISNSFIHFEKHPSIPNLWVIGFMVLFWLFMIVGGLFVTLVISNEVGKALLRIG